MIMRDESVEKADIVVLIGTYFPLTDAGGGDFRALCPFHDASAASFVVTPSRRSYRCFGCGAAGSIVDFVTRYEHVDEERALQMLSRWLDQ
jgi:DNA primase